MTTLDDLELLRRYAEERSESAFAEIVHRHLNLVYSAALRVVGGDAHLAEDVAQVVFGDLARQAVRSHRLLSLKSLPGWLYTNTCFAASKVVRGEQRRHAREQEAHSMRETEEAGASDSPWSQLRPVIDAAMLELGDEDREAVVLRYFDGRKLAEVGNRLGLSENAARMRVERAMEKLRLLLAKRGITSTTAALAVVLANQAVGAAPAGLAGTIAAASLAGAAGSGASLLNIVLMSKAKTLGIGAIMAAGALTPSLSNIKPTRGSGTKTPSCASNWRCRWPRNPSPLIQPNWTGSEANTKNSCGCAAK